jgi:hypothetical protein
LQTLYSNRIRMTEPEKYDRLRQRRDYLTERIKGKKVVGWETVYDEAEREALSWALELLKEKE